MKLMLAFLLLLAVTSVAQSADTWEKTKQCSDQAAKVMAELERKVPEGQYYTWRNHYSSKHDRCFITMGLVLKLAISNPMHNDFMYSGAAELVTEMEDAFERRAVASVERPDVDWNSLRIGSLVHKADPSRTLTRKLANGKTVQYELPTLEEQIARQIKLHRVTDPNATKQRCTIEDEDADCETAARFIAERMSN